MRRGEVWWVEIADEGRRPHLILTRDAAIPVLNAVIGVPATRSVRGIPTEVALGPDDGMPEACALALDTIRVIRKSFCTERICALRPALMDRVCQALSVATGCEA